MSAMQRLQDCSLHGTSWPGGRRPAHLVEAARHQEHSLPALLQPPHQLRDACGAAQQRSKVRQARSSGKPCWRGWQVQPPYSYQLPAPTPAHPPTPTYPC